MKDYYKMKSEELYSERLKLKSEIERINHALSFIEVADYNIKEMLWNRYLKFKEDTGNILIVEYKGGNSHDPKMYEYYEAKSITDKIYQTEITSDYLFWLNNNQHYLNVSFNWL